MLEVGAAPDGIAHPLQPLPKSAHSVDSGKGGVYVPAAQRPDGGPALFLSFQLPAAHRAFQGFGRFDDGQVMLQAMASEVPRMPTPPP